MVFPEERCERCDLMYIAEDRTSSANAVEQLNSAPVAGKILEDDCADAKLTISAFAARTSCPEKPSEQSYYSLQYNQFEGKI